MKSSSSLVPRKKDTFGHSHTISLVESSMEKLLKTCPTQVGDEPRDWSLKPQVEILLLCGDVVLVLCEIDNLFTPSISRISSTKVSR